MEDSILTEVVSDPRGLTPSSLSYDAVTRTVTATFTDITEGTYELQLVSGPNSFRDSPGNLLDGNGDGNGGDSFLLTFLADRSGATPLTGPLDLVPPAGSLIFSTQADGYFHLPGETDTFSVDLDAGPTLTLLLLPGGSSFGGAWNCFPPTEG